MEKLKIKNRKGQNIAVLVEESKVSAGLVFVMHGLGGFKEQLHIQTFRSGFKDKGYTIVSFDTTNTLGESDGDYQNATITNYYEDLEDVVGWAKTQSWWSKAFCLAGHSVGGFCTAFYAESHPAEVKALAPISTVISGRLILEAMPKDQLNKWKKTGWFIEESKSKPGVIKKLKWSFAEDSLEHNLLPKAKKLTMPVLMIVGEKDETVPLKHQKLLFDKLPGRKELHTIKGAPHTFRERYHLNEIKDIFSNWIDKV